VPQILLGFSPELLGKPDGQGVELRLQTLVNLHQVSAVVSLTGFDKLIYCADPHNDVLKQLLVFCSCFVE